MDFHKISENEDVEVYQAMKKAKTSPAPDGSEVRKYTPELPKSIDGTATATVLDEFDGYDIESIHVSKTGGITVAVSRGKDNPFEEKEPGVERLVTLKGGKK